MRQTMKRLFAAVAFVFIAARAKPGLCQLLDVQGPQFVTEPSSGVHFLNSEGAVITCRARGDPPPEITWITSDGRPLLKQRRLLEDFRNGTLKFYPFSPGAYRQDVHNAVYQCQAENGVGKILSRQVSIKAVIPSPYEIKLRDVTARLGDTVRFSCPMPNALREEVSATSWVRRPDFNIFPSTSGGEKYHMIPSGDLIIRNVEKADELHSFQCRTVHRLTGETTVSSLARVFIRTAPDAAVPGFVEAHSETISVHKGEPAILLCNFRGYSGLLKRWYRGTPNAGRALETSARISILPYALIINEARLEDSGAYFCDSESESGSAQKRIFLRVTAALSVNLHPASQVVDLGHSGELVCSITGGPITGGVRWLKDGDSLQETAGISLTGPDFSILRISRMETNFQGMYQCVVANEEDSAQGAAFVKLGAAKPRIKYKFIEQTLTADRFISLKCVAGGTPTPQIDWHLDRSHPPESNRFMIGQYLSSSGDVVSHVNITNVRAGDGGYYTCVASNKAGSDEHSAWLKVYGPPSVREIRPVSAVAGKDIELICPIGGHPLTITGWRKDSRNLPTDQRQKIMNNGTLLIRSVHPSTDDGDYFCTAQQSTHGQTVTARVQLQIMVLPTLAALSFPENLLQGARLSETCTVTQGESPVQITWYKDGVQIGGSSSSFLGLPAHRHFVQSSTSTARGNVDGITVRDISQFTSLLSIDSLRAEHSGEYACEARNSAGIARSTALLKVYVPPQMSPFHPSRVLEAGSRVQLQCVVEKGDPPLSIVWTKDGRRIPEELSARVVGLDGFSSILTVDSVGAMHSGNYSCRASNRAGHSTITTVLIVRVPPTWRIEPMNASGLVDQPLSVPCEADGYPRPTIQWKRSRGGPAQNFQPFLAYEGVQVAENGTMVIEKLSNSDAGLYLCEANNGIQNPVSKVISVIVNAPPSFSESSQVKRFRVGSEGRAECSASGDEPLRYQWFKDGNPIRPGAPSIKGLRIRTEENTTGRTKAVIDFDAVTAEAGGKYLCQATNSFGVSKLLVVVVVEEPPVAPASLFLKSATSSSVVVGWDMGRQRTNVLTGFIVEYKEIPGLWPNARSMQLEGNMSEATVTDLTPHTRYDLRISAVNDLGVSPPSPPLMVETESALPTGVPLDIQAIPKTSTEVFLQWIPPPEETWNGHVLGYKVGRVVCTEKGSEQAMTFLDVPVESTSLAQSATLRGLRPYTMYCFAVKMFNDVGDGPLSSMLEATTLEDVPGPPQQFKCQPLSPQSVSLAWSPPLENERHGEILGYQAFYHASDVDSEDPEMEDFQRESGIIAGLKKFTNYTVTVAAATKAGVGIQTEPTLCSTDEDVPGSPGDLKAVPASASSVAVAWGPPSESNGILVGYTIVQFPAANTRRRPGTTDGDNPEREIRLPPTATFHEMNNLDRRRRYRFCVTAHTRVGQSELLCSGTVSPAQKAPASILTFGGEVSGKSHSDVVLSCQNVGLPIPEIRWQLPDGQKLSPETTANTGDKSRLGIMPDGKLIIRDLGRNDSGNYTCLVTNDQGVDNVSHRLIVKSLPSAPTLYLESVTSHSITVGWTKVDAGNSEIKRFIVNYKKAFGGLWEERSAGKHTTSLALTSLDCGTSYQIYAAAVNEIGTGRASAVLNAETKGGKPPSATPETIISVNATSAVLNFKPWESTECPIERFKVQYKAASSNWDWILVGDSFGPDSYVPIRGLVPGTTYILSLTAFNPAGKTTLLHHFITKSLTGDAIRPAMPSSNEAIATKDRGLLYQPRFWVPVCTVVLAVVSVAAGVAYCVRARRLHRLRIQHQLTMGGELRKMKPNPSASHAQAALYRGELGNAAAGRPVKNPRHYGDPTVPAMEEVDLYPYATYHEVMDPSSSNYKLLSDPPPPPRCLIHPPDATKMRQMIITPAVHGKDTNTYVPEASVLASRPAKRFSRHDQHQHRRARHEGAEAGEIVMAGTQIRGRRHSQPTSEPQTSDSGSDRGEEDSEISATLGRFPRSRPGNTGRPLRPKSMAFKPDPGLK